MNRLADYARSRLQYWGTRLGLLAGLVAGYLSTNGAQVEKAINSIVPEPYRPLASIAVGIATVLIINGVQHNDVKKVAGQWQR